MVALAYESMAKVSAEVQPKLVKVFGSGGVRGVPHYGTGILVSEEGHVLTAYSAMLDTPDLRIHLPDGRRFHGKVIAAGFPLGGPSASPPPAGA